MKNNKTSLSSPSVAVGNLPIFVSAGWSSVRSKIGRCRFFRRPQDRQNTDFNVGLTPDLSRPSSPRNVSMRGIGAEYQSAPLYPAHRHCGMTNGASGFTLIELLVVVLIIGILAAVALPQYQKAVLRSQLSTFKNMTESVATAQEIYYMANGSYATKISDLDIEFPSGGEHNEEDNLVTYDWGFCSLEDPANTQCGSSTKILSYLAYHNTGTRHPGKRMCQGEKGTLTEKVCQQDTGDSACLLWAEIVTTCRYN